MTEIAAVLFDVDGTLIDTNYLHAVTWWEAFRQYGHHVATARIHRAIGMGSDKLLDHLLPGDRDRTVDDEIRSAHTTLYAPYWPRLRAFDGAADLLRACANRGLRVVLASSATEREMRALRDALDAEDVVTAATSSPTWISHQELREAGAVEIYEGPAELLECLQDSLIAR